MKRFIFKLQTVLNHRQKKEDILKKELADIKQGYEREKAVLAKLQEKLVVAQGELRDKQRTLVDAAELLACTNYTQRLKREIEVQIARVTDLAGEVRRTQERLIAASRDKKVLEKLKDKQFDEHKQEVERIEQGAIDEIATARHGRGGPNPLRSVNVE